ncbi:MAG: DNA topoisomerase I, partial [Nanoarchaeota archaeon]
KKISALDEIIPVLEKVAKQAESFIVATDFDVEGEVIGWNIIRFICHQENAKRMKFSSLTKPELEESFNHPLQSIEFGQAIAGETRHFLDWFYGINLSRALMSAIKSAGAFKILSIGRVQGPALKLIVDKERQIISFKPETYWQVFITIQGIELKHNKDITKISELEKFKSLKGKKADVKTDIEEQSLPPPFPFDLTALQIESYRLFGFTPARTLQTAQSLYLAGIISYPRTSSQKIPTTINPQAIIKRLSGDFNTNLCTRNSPIEGKKSDPAHPSIYPTGEQADISGDEFKLYSLIVKRFLACFCEDAILENKKISALVNDILFTARATTIKKKTWLSIYPASIQEGVLPTLNGQYEIEAVRVEEKETQPPKRYSPASIVSELEKRNLGTKSTRSSILETLYTRGYIEGTSIKATPLGIALVSTLEENSEIILDEALTREFEKEMDSLNVIKKNLPEKEKEIIKKAEATIKKIAEQFKKSENKIGAALLSATTALREAQKKEAELMPCPVCKKGQLAITFSRKTKRSFIACNAYPNCKTTFSLPPNGIIKKTGKLCECGFPKLIRLSKGKRPWVFCFNPTCRTKQEKEDFDVHN